MYKELNRLNSRNTWKIVDTPTDANIVGSKWVYRTKRDAAGNITSHRARLVTQGYSQVEGIDYNNDDTFASVTRLSSIRAILALANRKGYRVQQIDVKSTYLYGKLDQHETIYLKAPEHVKIPGLTPGQCLLLLVALCGLKQAG